eukprot:TRINITY_DN19209_c0_g1_i1.p1 TRINITY_DN19209_c0_g1~~TRINITY_DN19209_c0_g1_i1.p1  ORF type:complete len:438 (+),score=75.41 TRINITY_DN19209_c0_g1_i1:3-1316(+)
MMHQPRQNDKDTQQMSSYPSVMALVFVFLIASLVDASSFSFPARRALPVATKSDAKRQSETVFSSGAAWIGDVQIGSQQESFRVLLDTGSGTMAVYGSTCQECALQGVTMFNPGSSSSFELLGCQGSGCVCNSRGQCFSTASYGDGSGWSGIAGRDDLTIGGWTNKGAFAFMVNASNGFAEPSYDGILGLTYPNFGFPDSPIQDIIQARDGAPNMFWLGFNPDGTGVMTLGNPKPEYYNGGMQTLQVYPTQGSAYGWYVVRPQSMMLGQTIVGQSTAFPGLTIVDSGTTFLTLSNTLYSNLKTSFQNSYSNLQCFRNFWVTGTVCPLTETQRAAWPNMTFAFINNVQVVVTSKDYIIPDLRNPGYFGMAIGSIGNVNAGSVSTILGAPFMSGRYMGFDRDSNVIQFAESSGYTEIHNGDHRMVPMLFFICAFLFALL